MFHPEPPANVCKKQIGEPCKIKVGSRLKDPEGLASTGAHFHAIAFPVSTARHIYGMCPECPIQTTVCGQSLSALSGLQLCFISHSEVLSSLNIAHLNSLLFHD